MPRVDLCTLVPAGAEVPAWDRSAHLAPCFGSPTVVLGGGLLKWSDAEEVLGLFHLRLSSVGRLLKRKCEALISKCLPSEEILTGYKLSSFTAGIHFTSNAAFL